MNGLRLGSRTGGMGWSSPTPVEPEAGNWSSVASLNPKQYVVPPPPANDSAETRAELEQLRRITRNLTPADLPRMRRWSVEEKTVLTHWSTMADEMCRTYRLSSPAGARVQALLAGGVNTALIACWNNKYLYLRPRPTMLDPSITAVLGVPDHPSYPAGHPTVAGAASRILKQFFPQDSATFQDMTVDNGLFRLQAGAHFMSDIRAGVLLGHRVAGDILAAEARSGAPMRYSR